MAGSEKTAPKPRARKHEAGRDWGRSTKGPAALDQRDNRTSATRGLGLSVGGTTALASGPLL